MTIAIKRRARRIAADEAHAWARNLRLRNTVAKFILCDLTQYVDGDGYCFVSIPAIAEDTELSTSTVRSRLAWLEGIGVIARSAQWVDEYGHRNSKGNGRRTSDLIRLMIDLDQAGIEDRAAAMKEGRSSDETDADPPNVAVSGLEGQTDDNESRPSQRPSSRPSDSVEGLISEPEHEPESPPKGPPPGDLNALESGSDEVKEPEHFGEFWRAYPGHEVMSRYRALEVFVTMTPAEQQHARVAALAHAEALKKYERRPKDAYKWLSEKGWQEYPNSKIPEVRPQKRMIRGEELAALTLALKIAGQRPPSTITSFSEEAGRHTEAAFWGLPIGPDMLPLAVLGNADTSNWPIVEEGSDKFAAWRDRFKVWLGVDVEAQRIWLEPYNGAVHGLEGSDPNFRPRASTRGFRVPWPFPPSASGKLYPASATNEDQS